MKNQYRILCLIIALPLLFLMSGPSLSLDANADLQAKIMDMPYGQARQIILEQGWEPVANTVPDDLVFVSRFMYDEGYVEVDACSPVGTAPCVFYFKRPDKEEYLRVATDGEYPHVVWASVLDEEAYKESRPLLVD